MVKKLMNEPIGIIGLGDLGGRLATQALLHGKVVLAFDNNASVKYLPSLAIDPDINTTSVDLRLFSTTSIKNILQHCQIVHWAIASSQLGNLQTIPKNCTVVLHDSVMNNSLLALQNRTDKHQFVIAHCLMNDKKRVLVSTEFGDHEKVKQHLKDIGLAPKNTTVKDHDQAMARSQGVFALLLELGMREVLDKSFAAGDLTPSAMELRTAVINREANWTKQTIKSILGNPELLPFVHDMREVLAPIEK